MPPTRTPDAAGRLVSDHGVAIRARHRQRLPLEGGADSAYYIIRRGLFFVRGGLAGTRSQILSLLYPGDLVAPQAVPTTAQAGLFAASPGAEVIRLRSDAARALADTDPGLAHFISERLADLSVKMAVRGAMIAGLTSEQRVEALFVELAVRIGSRVDGGYTFDMPMTRVEIAEFLALNADTVSRAFSSLRAKGIIVRVGRRRFLVRAGSADGKRSAETVGSLQ